MKKSKSPMLSKLSRRLWPSVHETYTKSYDPKSCEVRVRTRVKLADYRRITPAHDMKLLKSYAHSLKNQKIVFVNATYAGGGVAIMRAPLIALLKSLGVNARWYVMRPDPAAFKVTKTKFHNVLQGVAGPGVHLTSHDKTTYWHWIEQNARILNRPLKTADIIVIDDWQPSGLIRLIKGDGKHPGINPDAKIIFRDHIQSEGRLMSTPDTPQYLTWRYAWEHNYVSKADIYIFHPRDEFVPFEVPNEKIFFMPATSDLLDDLNRPLTAQEIVDGYEFINDQLQKNGNQQPLDLSRRYMVLIARFDPSKGMPLALEAYAKARAKMLKRGLAESQLPQLVVIGNGSVDDPDGTPVLRQVMRLRQEKYRRIQDDIKVALVPPNDRALNTLLHGAALALQPSTKEGFESRVTDAILQGVPVIGSNKGGIPLQIVPGYSGYVIDPQDTEKWAKQISSLFTNTQKYAALKHSAKATAKTHNYQFTTVPNTINWLYLFHALATGQRILGYRQWVRNMVGLDKPPAIVRRQKALSLAGASKLVIRRPHRRAPA